MSLYTSKFSTIKSSRLSGFVYVDVFGRLATKFYFVSELFNVNTESLPWRVLEVSTESRGDDNEEAGCAESRSIFHDGLILRSIRHNLAQSAQLFGESKIHALG